MKPATVILALATVTLAAAGPTTIPEGTPLKLVLLRELAAGREKPGDTVPLMVLDDVKDPNGRVLISRGAIATAIVEQSRSEGMLSSVINRPARLVVRLESVLAVDGQTIPLAHGTKPKAEPFYAFTKENTGVPQVSEQLAELMKDEENVEVFEQVSMMFRAGEGDPLKKLPGQRDPLEHAAEVLGLPHTSQVLKSGRRSNLERALAQIRRSRSAWRALGDGALSLGDAGAVMELARLAGGVGFKIGLFRGRTLRAHPGTEVDAVVGKTVTIQIPGVA